MSEYVYGRHAVYHLLKSGRRPVHKLRMMAGGVDQDEPLINLARTRGVQVEESPKGFFERLEGAIHQGVVAETESFPFVDLDDLFPKNFLLLCDSIQDPQNLGALCRSAYLLGVEGVVLTANRAASISPGVCKAAAGAVEYLPISQVTSLANAITLLKEKEFWIYGADQEGPKSIYQQKFSGKVAIVIGGEEKGLSRLVRERCDFRVKIPMATPDLGSFNASVAGALILAEVFRQKSPV